MTKPTVYFKKATLSDPVGQIALDLLKKLESEGNITFEDKLPIKIHPGAPGNKTYIKAENFDEIAEYLLEKGKHPYFIETNMASGPLSHEKEHLEAMKKHNWTKLPCVIADGKDGYDHKLVTVTGGKHFKKAKIATKLAEAPQVLVTSHFKGHSMSGYGGALKMLGIGFASSRGKTDQHARPQIPDGEYIDWGKAQKEKIGEKTIWNHKYAWVKEGFAERVAEYAQAAVKDKQCIYISFALSLAPNCDCDGHPMGTVAEDIGVLASMDPVAIDAACIDLLNKREGREVFPEYGILEYAQKLGIGKKDYKLQTLK